MLTIIFSIALIYVGIKMLVWGIKATWGIAKIIAFVVLLPVILAGLAVSGLFMLALGLVIVMAVVSTVGVLLV